MRLFINSIWSLLKVLLHSKLSLLNSLGKLGGVEENKTLKILGNGQSLNESLSSFNEQNNDYMVVNRHVLSDSYESIKPRYYVLADPYFFRGEGLHIIEKIKTKTMWPLILYYPGKFKISQYFEGSRNIKTVPYNNISVKGWQWLKNTLYRKNLAMPNAQNVLVAAIYCAICLGYKTIELYGVEHSWTKYLSVNDNNEVCLENPHFFDTRRDIKTWKEIQGVSTSLCDVLKGYASMFESYIELEILAKNRNVNIINCTKGSFIDAFRRNVGV